MNKIKKTLLWALVFIIMAVLGVVYAFVANKNKIISVKIGDNVFRAEVAESMAQKSKGLSYRDGLDADSAMYFDFGSEGNYGFWMMGMRFPIDIIWIKNNTVVGIEKNVPFPAPNTPESALKLYYPPENIDKVLEVNAGKCDELGIRVGDKIIIDY